MLKILFYLMLIINLQIASLSNAFANQEGSVINQNSNEVSFNFSYEQESVRSMVGLGSLFKHLPDLFSGLFKIIGDIFVFIFDVIASIFQFIGDIFIYLWDGIRWIFQSIGDGFSWVARELNLGGVKHASAVLQNSDSTVKFVDFDSLNKSQRIFSTEQVGSDIDVFISVPRTTDDLKEVAIDPSMLSNAQKELEETKLSLNDSLVSDDSSIVRLYQDGSIDSFIGALDQSDSPYVAIIGHNENGKFRMYGEPHKTVDIEHMADLCVSFAKRCIFLSCNSKRFLNTNNLSNGVKWELSYLQAAKIIRSISLEFKKKRSVSLAESNKFLRKQEVFTHIKPKAQFIITSSSVTGGGVAGISYIEERFDRREVEP